MDIRIIVFVIIIELKGFNKIIFDLYQPKYLCMPVFMIDNDLFINSILLFSINIIFHYEISQENQLRKLQ